MKKKKEPTCNYNTDFEKKNPVIGRRLLAWSNWYCIALDLQRRQKGHA